MNERARRQRLFKVSRITDESRFSADPGQMMANNCFIAAKVSESIQSLRLAVAIHGYLLIEATPNSFGDVGFPDTKCFLSGSRDLSAL